MPSVCAGTGLRRTEMTPEKEEILRRIEEGVRVTSGTAFAYLYGSFQESDFISTWNRSCAGPPGRLSDHDSEPGSGSFSGTGDRGIRRKIGEDRGRFGRRIPGRPGSEGHREKISTTCEPSSAPSSRDPRRTKREGVEQGCMPDRSDLTPRKAATDAKDSFALTPFA